MNLYIVNVIIPATKASAQRTLQTKVLAPDEATARRLAVTNCPQAKGTLAYGEIVKSFLPLVGMSVPSKVAPVVARRRPSPRPLEGGRRPRKNAMPAPVTQAKRIPACPGRAFSLDDMSLAEALSTFTTQAEGEEWLTTLQARASRVATRVRAEVAAEVAGDLDAELNPTTDSNFMVGVASAYDVESGGWDGWSVRSR